MTPPMPYNTIYSKSLAFLVQNGCCECLSVQPCFLCRWFSWELRLLHGVLWYSCSLLKLKPMSKNSDGTLGLEYYMYWWEMLSFSVLFFRSKIFMPGQFSFRYILKNALLNSLTISQTQVSHCQAQHIFRKLVLPIVLFFLV